jgi:endonuclease-3
MINRKEDPKKIWKKIWPVLNKRYTRTATFLDYRTPFQLLISVILSAQTTDDGVNKVTPRLWEKYPKPEDLMRASNSDISKIIRTVGYYNAKTRYIKETAKQIVQRYSSTVPSDEKELQTLPGVGRKTAVAVISNAFNKNIGIPVDTHVIRFVGRFGLSQSKNPDRIEQELLKIIPKQNWRRAGYAIKEYGRKEGRARGYKQDEDPIYTVLNKK